MSGSGERRLNVPGMHLTPLGGGALLLEPGEALDPSAPDPYMDAVLVALARHHCTRLIYDLSGSVLVDEIYYRWLERLAWACRISGAEMVAVNIPPAAAYALALRLKESPPFRCELDVDRARHS